MTSYIEGLSQTEEEKLLSILGFKIIPNGINKGNEKYTTDLGFVVYHSYNKDYADSQDYEDYYLTINDFIVKGYYPEKTTNLRNFLSKKYGSSYDLALGAYIKKFGDFKELSNPSDDIPTA